MVRNYNGARVDFLRFHNADHIVVEDSGKERVLPKAVWKSLPDWHDQPVTVDGAQS
jgi:hypothetical protein